MTAKNGKDTQQEGNTAKNGQAGAQAEPELMTSTDYPWAGTAHEDSCILACNQLAYNLQENLELNGKRRSGTVMTACGLITGFAGQLALFTRLAESNDTETLEKIRIVETEGGAKYSYGDVLNDMILSTSNHNANAILWPLICGSALSNGLDRGHLPPFEDMFRYVSTVISQDKAEFPSVPEKDRADLAWFPLLELVWPLAMMCFNNQLPGLTPQQREQVKPLPVEWWPVVAAHASAICVNQAKDDIELDTALTMIMESAIYATKIEAILLSGPNA